MHDEFVDRLVVGAVGYPATFAADSSRPHVEDLNRHLERVGGHGEHICVGAVRQHDGVSFGGLAQRIQRVADHRRPLVLLGFGRGPHLPGQLALQGASLARPERTEIVGDLTVLVGGHSSDAGSRTFADVTEQAGTIRGHRIAEDAVAARSHREDPEQQIHRFPNRPRLTERPVVAPALALDAATDEDPGELLAPGDAQPRIRLVVAVLDVEPGVELLDPGVFELQRLNLVSDHRPTDGGGGAQHGLRPEVQARRVGEVGVEAVAQVLRLTDVDDLAVRVAESVNTRIGWD